MFYKYLLPLGIFIIATIGSLGFFIFQNREVVRTEEATRINTTDDDFSPDSALNEEEQVIREVKLLVDRMEPRDLIVKVGEKIQFNSADGRSHVIGQGDGADPDAGKGHDHPEAALTSGTFGPDEGYLVTIEKPGVYSFHDHLHPELFATVVVYIPEGEAKDSLSQEK